MNANTNTAASFTLDTLSINGKSFPASYSVTPSGTVYAFVTILEDGKPVNLRVKIEPSEAAYGAALAAARKESTEAQPAQEPSTPAAVQAAPVQEASAPAQPSKAKTQRKAKALSKAERNRIWKICDDARDARRAAEPEDDLDRLWAETLPEGGRKPKAATVPANEPAQEPAQAAPVQEPSTPAAVVQAAAAPAQEPSAPASVPEKSFVGQTIQGTGWKIVFDGDASRTRVIVQDDAPEAIRAAVQAAGFFWSKPLASFNKKLTFKAYRAAQALALQLHTIQA